MAVNRAGGALAALAMAGLAYFFKNRAQVKRQVSQLGDRAQGMLGQNEHQKASTTSTQSSTPSTGAAISSGDWSPPTASDTVRT